MPSGYAERRERFFDRMAKAHAAVGRSPGKVSCPICLEEFGRDALDSRILTLEDVPPKSAGGRPMCLTCRTCNNDGGRLVDSAIAEMLLSRRFRDAVYSREGRYSGGVRLTAPGIRINAHLRADENGVQIEIDPRRNNPANTEAFRERYRPGASAAVQPAQFTMTAGFRWGMGSAFAGFLRVGYLAAFSMFGYSLATLPEIAAVRDQIRDPRREIVRRSAVAIVAPSDASRPDPHVAAVTAPIEGIMIYLPERFTSLRGGVAVLLPWPDVSQLTFFETLAANYVDVEGSRRVDFTAVPIGWPGQPELMIDLAED